MTGTGSSANPYIVSTVQELREVAVSGSVYIKFGDNIDCNRDKYYEWTTLNIGGCNIDFNGFALMYVYLGSGQSLFVADSNPFTLANGKITRLFGENCNNILKAPWNNPCVLDNIAVSGMNVKSIAEELFLGMSTSLCNFDIYCSSGSSFCSNGNLKNSRIKMDRSIQNTNFNALLSGIITVDGCRIEGSLKTLNAGLNMNYYLNATINNSVIAIDNTDVVVSGTRPLYKSGVNNIVNVDTVNESIFTLPSSVLRRTTEQMLSPSYNNANGFAVVEV